MKQYNKLRKSHTLVGLDFVEMIPSPRLGFLRGVFLANHLASTDKLIRTTKRPEHIATKTNDTQKEALINNNTV